MCRLIRVKIVADGTRHLVLRCSLDVKMKLHLFDEHFKKLVVDLVLFSIVYILL